MIIGLDVGGTFTDAVLLDEKSILNSAKYPTAADDVGRSILTVLDQVMEGIAVTDVHRLVLSTTIVTNLLLHNQGVPTGVILFPGPGMPLQHYQRFEPSYVLSGAMDFRGRELVATDEAEIATVLQALHDQGILHVAVCGKFSNRNPGHERLVRQIAEDLGLGMTITLGSEIAAPLNYSRRIVTTYYSLKVRNHWHLFLEEVARALAERGIQCDLEILKADGGTMTMTDAVRRPCEAIFTGPAASIMGAKALQRTPGNAMVLDIGGTSTDIALLVEGEPLYASKGALINGQYSHIRSFAQTSIALGGDSPIIVNAGAVTLGAVRHGPAICWGGDQPTLTDLFNWAYDLNLGDCAASHSGLESLAKIAAISLPELQRMIEIEVETKLDQAIEFMSKQWREEPAYHIWEIMNQREFQVNEIIGIGAAAGLMVPALAQRRGIAATIHTYSPVANALGAALAAPTLQMTVHIDTERGVYQSDQDGMQGKLEGRLHDYQLEQARSLAVDCFRQLAQQRGLIDQEDRLEYTREEQFNVMRSYKLYGKIFEIQLQLAPSLLPNYQEVLR